MFHTPPWVALLWVSSVWAVPGCAQTFKLLRYNDNLTSFQKDTSSDNNYVRFKYRTLNEEAGYLSMGGEVRYLIQNYVNEDWGDGPVREYTAFYTRMLFHSDVRLSQKVRFFGQLNSTFANGRVTPPRSIDENRLAVHQLFSDLQLHARVAVRVGRQEILYGSQRLISVREGPNNRLTFDAARLMYRVKDMEIDLLLGSPVLQRPAAFDDAMNRQDALWGWYVVRKEIPVVRNVDVYYLGQRREQAEFDALVGSEIRHSFGTRWWGSTARCNYDVEGVVQTGSLGSNRIVAWTASLNSSYRITQGQYPVTVGMKTEIISGDRNRGDNQLNTFNPLYPRGAYFGLAALIGPANLVDVHPGIEWQLHRNLSMAADFDLFWRHSLADGIYGPNVALIYSGEASVEKYIGQQWGISAEFTPGIHLSIVPEFTWFQAGTYLREVGSGKDVFFSALTVQYKY